jgi:type II secretory pathway pseudopilin PulG
VRRSSPSEAGFSLVELLVAMLVTLVVSGAIFAFMQQGQTAFRREPALSERQQNVRIAMDLVMRDVASAGIGLDAFSQAFTDGLDDPAAGSVPSEIHAGQRADLLELLTTDGACTTLVACDQAGFSVAVTEAIPTCFGLPGFVYLAGRGGAAASDGTPGLLFARAAAAGSCGRATLDLPAGAAGVNPGAGTCETGAGALETCDTASPAQLIRYELAPDSSAGGEPALWRSARGRHDRDGAPNSGPPGGPGSDWQVVASGIEDLQVEYQTAGAMRATPETWSPTPGAVACADCAAPVASDFDTIVARVRIRLLARARGPNLGGETEGAVSVQRRGELVAVVTPRAALAALRRGGQWR